MKVNMHSSAISENSGGFILYFDVKQIRKKCRQKGVGFNRPIVTWEKSEVSP